MPTYKVRVKKTIDFDLVVESDSIDGAIEYAQNRIDTNSVNETNWSTRLVNKTLKINPKLVKKCVKE